MVAIPQITNPGNSENLSRQVDLADAIAASLTETREAGEAAARGEEPKPSATEQETQTEQEPARVEPEPEQEPQEAAEAADGEQAENAPDEGAESDEEVTETPEAFSLADFAEAADLSTEEMLDRLSLEVKGKGGNVESLSLRDVLSGYRFEAANTRRAQELADERRQVETTLGEIKALHDQAAASLTAQNAEFDREEEALRQQYQGVDWNQLREAGNGSYADLQAQFQQAFAEVQRRRDVVGNAYANLVQQQQEVARRRNAEVMPAKREEMFERIPEWRDSERFEKESNEVTRHVVERYGFKQEDIAGLDDPRIIHLLHRLWTLEGRAGKVPAALKKVRAAPKLAKPGQRANREDDRTRTRRKLKGNLRASGKRADLAALVLDSMRNE